MPAVARFCRLFVSVILAFVLRVTAASSQPGGRCPAPAEPKQNPAQLRGPRPAATGPDSTWAGRSPTSCRGRGPTGSSGRPDQEEQPEAMLDALKIPPGATVADVGAGQVTQHPPGPAGRARGAPSWPPTSSPRCSRCSSSNARAAGVSNIKPLLCYCQRHQAARRQGRPDPDGRRLPRMRRPRDDPAEVCARP